MIKTKIQEMDKELSRGLINLNMLSKTEWNTVMEIARKYTGPVYLDNLIEDLKATVHDLNEEDIKRIIRKLRSAPVTKFRDLR